MAAGAALDALIRQEIEAAEHRAIEKGATERDVCALLAGLALLPPPVPGGELAAMPSAENRGTIGGGVAEAKALTFPAAKGRRSGEPGLSPRSGGGRVRLLRRSHAAIRDGIIKGIGIEWSINVTPICALGHFCPRWTISHGAVIAAGKAPSHRRFVKLSCVLERPAVRGSGQQILSRIARPTDVVVYPIRSMIRHQTRDNALMSPSSSTKRIKSGWRRCSAVVAIPHRFSLAILRAEIVINTASSFLARVSLVKYIGWMCQKIV